MLSEARSRGLTLKAAPGADPDAFTRVRSTQDKDGRIYDSRNGLSGYYRYGPRSVAALSDTKFSADKRDRVKIAIPKIHESVFDRISVDAHLYAPVALPPAYEILTYDERIVSPDDLTVRPNQPKYESSGAARRRERTQEHEVGSSIWRRRIIYFLTVIASIYLLTYPLTSHRAGRRRVHDAIAAAFRRHSHDRVGAARGGGTLDQCLCQGAAVVLAVRRTGRTAAVVERQPQGPDHRPDASRVAGEPGKDRPEPGKVQKRETAASAALIAVSVGLALIALYPVPGWVGYALPKASGSLQIFIDRITHPYFQFFAFAILVTMWLPGGTIARFRLTDAYRQFITSIKLKIAPAFFALAFLVGGFGVRQPLSVQFSRQLWPLLPARGKAGRAGGLRPGRHEAVQAGFRRQLPEHLHVQRRVAESPLPNSTPPAFARRSASCSTARQLPVRPRAEWRMVVSRRAIRTGRNAAPRIFFRNGTTTCRTPAAALGRFVLLAAAYPAKRTLDRPFGRVIVRYGETGNEENFIDGEPQPDGRLDETFRATRNGQMFVYLNQPVSGVFPSLFRNVNSGKARVWVYRIPR